MSACCAECSKAASLHLARSSRMANVRQCLIGRRNRKDRNPPNLIDSLSWVYPAGTFSLRRIWRLNRVVQHRPDAASGMV
jgi:hypothetical protein